MNLQRKIINIHTNFNTVTKMKVLKFGGTSVGSAQRDVYKRQAESYCWYSGIWHGIFLPINFVRSLIFDDVLYKAVVHTTAYSVFYWIFGISSVLSFIFGGNKR